MYTFIDLFSGAGGFHLGVSTVAKCVFACEWNTQARTTYLHNFAEELAKNDATFATDITEVDAITVPDHDILCGGFPCQPFSVAGPQAGFAHPTQGTLFFNVLGIIHAKKPRVVFLENVKGLLMHDNGNTFRIIKESLEEAGYTVKHSVLSGLKHGGVPQNRERLFIVAFKDKEVADRFEFPATRPAQPLPNFLEHTQQPAKYHYHDVSRASTRVILDGVNTVGNIYQFRRSYMRKAKEGTCPTLTANMGTGGNNTPIVKDQYGVRKLTPRECFNLQGFPASFEFPKLADSHLYKQAGNSVVVPVIALIAEQIAKALQGEKALRCE